MLKKPSFATGDFWNRSPRSRGQITRNVCERLDQEYRRPRHGNPTDPIDDLVYVVLSNQTPQARALRIFRKLKRCFPSWQDLLEADPDDVEEVIRPAGFAHRRTRQFQEAFEQILEDFGDLRSSELWQKGDGDLLDYLTSLRGISDKVARCVMMYTLERKVLPVDVHVHRIAKRLNWTNRNHPRDSHQELESLLPEHRYYSFHVGSVAHGRLRCTATNPACDACPIRRYCSHAGGPLSTSNQDH